MPSLPSPSALRLALSGVALIAAAAWSWRTQAAAEAEAVREAEQLLDLMALVDGHPSEAPQDPERWRRCVEAPTEAGCAEVRATLIAAPPVDPEAGLALVDRVGAGAFLNGPPGREPLVLGWSAGRSPRTLSEDNLLVLGLATATLLGSPPLGPGQVEATARVSLAAQEELRLAMEERCGRCALPPSPMPSPPDPAPVRSAVIAGERLLRSAAGGVDTLPPAGALVAAIRGGQPPPAEALETPGLAGLAALELGRRGQVEDLPLLLELAWHAPVEADRLAAIYAALRVAGGEEGLRGWGRARGRLDDVERVLAMTRG